MAPSRRMVSPLSMGFSRMCSAVIAYSLGWPRRAGLGTDAPSDWRTASGSLARMGVSNRPGAMVHTRMNLEARSRAATMVMPITPALDEA